MRDEYFDANIGGNHPNVKKQSTGVSIPTLIVSMIATALLVLLIVAKWDNILSIFGEDWPEMEQDSTDQLHVWDEVSLTWIIAQWWDMSTYTHTVDTIEYGLLGLKSSKINLANYDGEVYFQWFVEKIHQWVPVISVSTIYETDFEEGTGDEVVETQAKYLPKVWVYLDDKFFEKYGLLNEWNGGALKVKELDSNQIIEIQYFVCDKNSTNENCDKLVKNIWGGATQKFVDSYGNTYYKQPEVESWFFTNGIFGYFINDIQDSYVKNLSKNIILINKKYVQDTLSKSISKLCSAEDSQLNSVSTSDVKFQNSKILYVVSWKGAEWQEIDCELEFDPVSPSNSKLVKYDVKWDTWDDTKDEDTTQEDDFKKDDGAVALDPSVKQFPLKPEWWLVYTSSRWWYSLQFPSANIAYEASASSTAVWDGGLKCPYVINVIKYADKDNLKESPTVQIYECVWDANTTSWAPWIVIYSKANKVFVAKVNDSAWFDFANNLSISEIE